MTPAARAVVTALIGIALLAAGVAVQFGPGWAMITAGVCVVVGAVLLYPAAEKDRVQR